MHYSANIDRPSGKLRNCSRVDPTHLPPEAVRAFAALLAEHPGDFRAPVPVQGVEGIELDVRRLGGHAASAWILKGDQPIVLLALLPGLEPKVEQGALDGLVDVWEEANGLKAPRFVLLNRPAIVTMPLASLRLPPDQAILLMEAIECLMAAWCEAHLENRG